jgi:hypothetical protein
MGDCADGSFGRRSVGRRHVRGKRFGRCAHVWACGNGMCGINEQCKRRRLCESWACGIRTNFCAEESAGRGTDDMLLREVWALSQPRAAD